MPENKNEVKKTFLEKRLENRAIENFEREWYAFKNLLDQNKIARLTKFGVVYKTKEGEEKRVELSLYQLVDNFSRYGNYSNVYKARVEELTKQETENLFSKMENISYLFEQG